MSGDQLSQSPTPYPEQALIPEIAGRAAKRHEVACPECTLRTVGFGETWPPWCVCGWNVGAARTALWQQRIWIFIAGLIALGVGSLIGVCAVDVIDERDMPELCFLAIPVVTLGGSYLMVRWGTGWQARALSRAPAVPGEARRFSAAMLWALLAIGSMVLSRFLKNCGE